MIYALCIMIGLFIIGIIVLITLTKINTINNYNIKIKEAIKSIDILQEKELALFTKISKKVNPKLDEKILTNITKIKNKDLNMFERQEEFYSLHKEVKNLLTEGSIELEPAEKALFEKLKTNSIELSAVETYYNEQADAYNSYIKKFHNLLIKLFKRLKKVETFTFKKVVEFEILEETTD